MTTEQKCEQIGRLASEFAKSKDVDIKAVGLILRAAQIATNEGWLHELIEHVHEMVETVDQIKSAGRN